MLRTTPLATQARGEEEPRTRLLDGGSTPHLHENGPQEGGAQRLARPFKNLKLGAINTVILICSSVTMVVAWAQLKMNKFGKGRAYVIVTAVLALVFLVNKYFEYAAHFNAGEGPWHSTFLAIYFTLTGLHGLHILGGIIVMAYLAGPGAGLWKRNPGQYTNRVEYTGLYWHFVDLVWIFLFPVLYLL